MSVINRNLIPYYINVDSRMKNTGEVVTKDEYILNCQSINFLKDNNLLHIAHLNHCYKSGDIISIKNFNPPCYLLNIYDDDNLIILDVPNGSDFMKVCYPHGVHTCAINEYFEIELCNVKGIKDNNRRRTFCGIPLDIINSKHKILFELDPNNYKHLTLCDNYFLSSNNHFFIKFNMVTCYSPEDKNKIKPHLFKLIRHYVAGINSDYLVNLCSGAVIKNHDINGYCISLCDFIPLYDECYEARELCISKIINTKLCGQVNNYVMNLGKTYNNIYSVRLCSTEFPNMRNRLFINDCQFYWCNYEDNCVNKISICSGIYSLEDLATTLTRESLCNLNAMKGCYIDYLQFTVEKHLDNKFISIKSFKCIELCKPLRLFDCNKICVCHPDHNVKIGSVIRLESCENNLHIQGKIIFLNRYYKIICIMDKDHYEIIPDCEYFDASTVNRFIEPGVIRILFPQLFTIQYDKCKIFCDLLGIKNCTKLSSCFNTKYFNEKFDYFYMIIKPFQTFDLNNVNIYSPFAKIQLGGSDSNCNVLYNTFVDIPKIYYDPIKTISCLEISFVDPLGKPYNFGNLNHSFTLEFITIDDSPGKSLLNPNTLKNYGAKIFE